MTLKARWQRWFFRNTGPEPSPVFLDRRRIYILPTRTGLLFVSVLVAMYVGAINYNLGLGHALVYLLVGLGLVGMVHTYRNIVGLGFSPGRCPPVFAGDAARFHLIAHNRRADARFAVNLQENSRDAAPAWTQRIAPQCDREIVVETPSGPRGRRALGRLRVSSRYPLGIFEAWSYPYPAATILVYPAPRFTPLPAPLPAARAGDIDGALGEEDFSGFRPRQPSDSPRHVAWKAFARDPDHQPLLVKTFAGGSQPEIWLDWNATPSAADIETRLSTLCGWVLLARRDGLSFGLRLPNAEVPPAGDAAHADACLERLALFGLHPAGAGG